MHKEVKHYTSPFNDFFTYETTTSKEFVIAGIKPAYALYIDAMDLDKDTIDDYLKGSDFQKNYEKAKRLVEQYISDVYNKTNLANISKHPLLVITARNDNSTYVIKGEFVLRVINDFSSGKIKLVGIDHKEFAYFIADNTPYWKDSMIEMTETIINIDSDNLDEYTFLLDRYEIYDTEFLERLKTAVDIFIF